MTENLSLIGEVLSLHDNDKLLAELFDEQGRSVTKTSIANREFALSLPTSSIGARANFSEYDRVKALFGEPEAVRAVMEARRALEATSSPTDQQRRALADAEAKLKEVSSNAAGFIAVNPKLAVELEGKQLSWEPNFFLKVTEDPGASGGKPKTLNEIGLLLVDGAPEIRIQQTSRPVFDPPEYGWAFSGDKPPGDKPIFGLPRAKLEQEFLGSPRVWTNEAFKDNYLGIVGGRGFARLSLLKLALDPVQLNAMENGRSIANFAEKVLLNVFFSNDLEPFPANDIDAIQRRFAEIWARIEEYPEKPTDPERQERRRTDDYLVDRTMNGIYPALFQTVPDQPTQLCVDLRWDDLSFDGPYDLPNVKATFQMDGADGSAKLTLLSFEIRYRGTDDEQPTWLRDRGHLILRDANSDSSDFTAWSHAKRLFRQALLLAGEIDAHITRGHLLCEQYQIAMLRTLSKTHPLRTLLETHIDDAIYINNYGNPTIFDRDHGVLSRTSALTGEAVLKRASQVLGGLNWRGFEPRGKVGPNHRFAIVGLAYWNVLDKYARSYFEKHPLLPADWKELEAFSADLLENAPPFVPYLQIDRGRFREADRNEIASSHVAPIKPKDLGEVLQLAKYVVYHATYFHGWCNDEQFEDGGELLHASFGLQSRDLPRDREDWKNRFAPEGPDAALQLFIAELLAKTESGRIPDRVATGSPLATLQELLKKSTEFPEGTKGIRSRLNI